jgi:hypothetical protein
LHPTAETERSPARARSVVLDPEANLDTDLKMLDLAVHNYPSHLGYFDPVDVAQGASSALDAVSYGLVDAIG